MASKYGGGGGGGGGRNVQAAIAVDVPTPRVSKATMARYQGKKVRLVVQLIQGHDPRPPSCVCHSAGRG